MSDLAATNCHTSSNGGSSCGLNLEGNSCLWIILLLFFCGGNNGWKGSNGCGCDIIWILILLSICGGGTTSNTCGLSCGCGCGC